VRYRFTYRRYALPFKVPIRTGHGLWTKREGILLRLSDEADAETFAEIAPIPEFGTETVEEAEEVCRGLGEYISEDAMRQTPAWAGCVKMALGTLFRNLSAGRADSSSTGYLSVAALLPAGKGALETLPGLAEAGFRTFKWKVGAGDAQAELALLDDVLAATPKGAKLRLDANGAWDRRRAELWLARCADRPIEFVEQPVAHDGNGAEDLLLGLANDYPTPIGLDESAVKATHVARWLELGWPGVFVVKPSLLDDPVAVVERLKKAKASIIFSSALETAVGARAALKLAFDYADPARAIGFGVWPLFETPALNGPTRAPFVRREDVEAIDPLAAWNALN
jgi:O-succinylbenzoate synthase